MTTVLKYVTCMYEKELYSNVIKAVDLALSACDQNKDLTPLIKFQFYLYCADSNYHLQQYQQAEEGYAQALQIRKFIMKIKPSGKVESQDIASDVDIKYKMHLCYMRLKNNKKAIEILQSISCKLRNSKINMALGSLYRDGGCERSAICCYKEVLRENPLAVEAAENLLKLAVKGTEVNSLMLEATSELGWMNMWLRAHAQMHSKDYQTAINTFKSIDTPTLLKDNSSLLVTIAYCYIYLCDTKSAQNYLQRAIRIDPNMRVGRDLYASLLARSQDKDDLQELDRLVNIDLDVNLWTSEQWVVVGYSMFAHKRYIRASSFGQKACTLNRKSVEGLLLKAYSLMEINKMCEALIHFKDANMCAPCRFEPYKGLIDCYLALTRTRDAVNIAINACKELKNSPQSLTLYAKVLQKDPSMTSRVRDLLDKALTKDPAHHPAVWLLVEHLQLQLRFEEACTILMTHVKEYPASRSHQMLAECYVQLFKEEEALTHYTTAIRLDPFNQRALEGLNKIGRGGKLDSTFFMPVGGESSYTSQVPSVPSDHELDAESDPDLWTGNSDFMY